MYGKKAEIVFFFSKTPFRQWKTCSKLFEGGKCEFFGTNSS
jgi:hypothetical protein